MPKLTTTPGPGCVSSLPDGKYKDDATEHLYLWVRRGGKSRIWVYRFKYLGLPREHSLGSTKTLALGAARKAATVKNGELAAGRDPFPRTPRPATPQPVTLWADCLEYYHLHLRTWKGHTPVTKMGHMLRYIGNPTLSDAERAQKRLPPVACGDWVTAEITVDRLKPLFYRRRIDAQGVAQEDPTALWLTHNETAQRVLSLLQGAIDLALHRDRQQPEAQRRFPKDYRNPATGLLLYELPKACRPAAVPRRSIPYEHAPRCYQRLLEIAGEAAPHPRNHNGGPALEDWTDSQRSAAQALLTMIETLAPRAAEIFDLTWAELDLDAALWIVPRARMKVKTPRNQRVVRDLPLLPCTVARLRALRPAEAQPTDYVFPGASCDGRRLGEAQMNKLMQHLAAQGYGAATPHGWRTTAKGWVTEHVLTLLDEKAMDIALDHWAKVDTAVGAAYNDRTLLHQRRLLATRYLCFLRDEPYRGAYAAYPAHDRALRPWAYPDQRPVLVVDNDPTAPDAAA